MRYLLNVNSRTIHNADSRDGRCRLNLLKDENKMQFPSFEEAMHCLPGGNKPTKPCVFCLGKDYSG